MTDPDEPISAFAEGYGLSAKVQNILRRHDIKTLRQLASMTREEFRSLRNVGDVAEEEARKALRSAGLDWAGRIFDESDMLAAFEFGLGLYDDDGYFPDWIEKYRRGVRDPSLVWVREGGYWEKRHDVKPSE